jgi:hypothetical protein
LWRIGARGGAGRTVDELSGDAAHVARGRLSGSYVPPCESPFAYLLRAPSRAIAWPLRSLQGDLWLGAWAVALM